VLLIKSNLDNAFEFLCTASVCNTGFISLTSLLERFLSFAKIFLDFEIIFFKKFLGFVNLCCNLF